MRGIIRPRRGYESIASGLIHVWRSRLSELSVPRITPESLEQALRRSSEATREELRLHSQWQRAMQARVIADDAAYRMLLDAWAVLRVAGRRMPGVITALKFVGQAFKRRKRTPRGPGKTPAS